MELHERFRQQALSYCGAADVLWDADIPKSGSEKPHNHYLGPCLQCVGYGYELFLKTVLLKNGLSSLQLRSRPYGHDIWHMWNKDILKSQRDQAQLHAEICHQELANEARGIEPPKAGTFLTHLEHLSKLHSQSSDYALRYPEEQMLVPEPSLLIAVLDRLVRAEKHGERIIRI